MKQRNNIICLAEIQDWLFIDLSMYIRSKMYYIRVNLCESVAN